MSEQVLFCPKCAEEGKESTLRFELGGVSTLMCSDDYIDENNRLHCHDPNSVTTNGRCSNGHNLGMVTRSACPQGCLGFTGSRMIFVTKF